MCSQGTKRSGKSVRYLILGSLNLNKNIYTYLILCTICPILLRAAWREDKNMIDIWMSIILIDITAHCRLKKYLYFTISSCSSNSELSNSGWLPSLTVRNTLSAGMSQKILAELFHLLDVPSRVHIECNILVTVESTSQVKVELHRTSRLDIEWIRPYLLDEFLWISHHNAEITNTYGHIFINRLTFLVDSFCHTVLIATHGSIIQNSSIPTGLCIRSTHILPNQLLSIWNQFWYILSAWILALRY